MNDEVKLGAILLAGSGFMWFYAIPNHIKGEKAALFPNILILTMVLFGLYIFVKGIRGAVAGDEPAVETRLDASSFKSLFVVLLMVIYVYLIDIVGYYAITFLFINIFMIYFGTRKPIALGLFSILLPLVVYLIIGKVLSFPFPDGFLF